MGRLVTALGTVGHCGVDLTVQNNDEDTPLHLARQEQVNISPMFIERGVDVAAQNNNKETPLNLASNLSRIGAATNPRPPST